MSDCIFCKIVKGDLPKYLVYEDSMYLGFLNINPRTKGHTLLIPKKHYQWVYEVPRFGEFWEKGLVVSKAIEKSLSPLFITYFTFGLHVPHAHIHIVPQYSKNIEEGSISNVISTTKEEFEDISQKIRSGLS